MSEKKECFAVKLTDKLEMRYGGCELAFEAANGDKFVMQTPRGGTGGDYETLMRIAKNVQDVDDRTNMEAIAINQFVQACILRHPHMRAINKISRIKDHPKVFGWWDFYKARSTLSLFSSGLNSANLAMVANQLEIAARYLSGLCDESELVSCFEQVELLRMEWIWDVKNSGLLLGVRGVSKGRL